MADAADRALSAFQDVLAVEWDEEAGVARIVTMSDCYTAVPEHGQHLCPDREYHLDGSGLCKHLFALEITRGKVCAPEGWLVVDDLDERSDDEIDLDIKSPREDCPDCMDEMACPEHYGLTLGLEGGA